MKIFWLSVPVFLMSCASADEYPQNWATLRTDAACSDIVGNYENVGELAVPDTVRKNYKDLDSYKPKLSDDLFQTSKDRIAAMGGDFIEISRYDSVLRVCALQDLRILVSVQYAENLLHCKDGWLTVAIASSVPDSVLGVEEDITMLHLATDGSLVVKRLSKGAGLAFFAIPAAGSTVAYVRFPRRQ